MSTKGALKAVRAAIDAKQWDVAAEKARDLLKDDAKNYNAYVTLINKVQHLTIEANNYFSSTETCSWASHAINYAKWMSRKQHI